MTESSMLKPYMQQVTLLEKRPLNRSALHANLRPAMVCDLMMSILVKGDGEAWAEAEAGLSLAETLEVKHKENDNRLCVEEPRSQDILFPHVHTCLRNTRAQTRAAACTVLGWVLISLHTDNNLVGDEVRITDSLLVG